MAKRVLRKVVLENQDPSLAQAGIALESRQTILISIAGLILIVSGIALVALNVSGVVELYVALPGLSVEVSKATPGVAIALFGGVLCLFSRPHVVVKQARRSGEER